jgi:hypothetical protein
LFSRVKRKVNPQIRLHHLPLPIKTPLKFTGGGEDGMRGGEMFAQAHTRFFLPRLFFSAVPSPCTRTAFFNTRNYPEIPPSALSTPRMAFWLPLVLLSFPLGASSSEKVAITVRSQSLAKTGRIRWAVHEEV